MIIILNNEDLQEILKGKEYSRSLPIGKVRVHDFSYEDGKLSLLLDYPMNQNVHCELDSFTVKQGSLVCRCEIYSKLTKSIVSLLTKFISLPGEVFNLQYPELRINLSSLNLPITLQSIECLPDGVRITGEYL